MLRLKPKLSCSSIHSCSGQVASKTRRPAHHPHSFRAFPSAVSLEAHKHGRHQRLHIGRISISGRPRGFAREPQNPPICISSADCSATIPMAPSCSNIHWHHGCVERDKRQNLLNQKGCIVWITGLSGSGKSTLACAVDQGLASMGKLSYVLDGDNVRHGLCKNLGFSAEDREENIRRVGEVAKLFADAGLIALVSFISPYKRDREFVRGLVKKGEYMEVYMKVPLAVCEGRDCKGLYKLARAGKIKGFTGVDDPYEKPENPEVILEATNAAGEFVSPERMAQTVIQYLDDNGVLSGRCS